MTEQPPRLRPCAICGEVSEHVIHGSDHVPSGRAQHAFVPVGNRTELEPPKAKVHWAVKMFKERQADFERRHK